MSAATIRICHVITRLDLGGAQGNTLHTVASLRRPFQASLVCGAGGLLDAEAARLEGVPVTFLDDLVRPIHPARDFAALLRLAALFRRERPHIVHTHSSKAGILGRLAARHAGVPIRVHSIHGFGFNDEQPALLRGALVGLERMVAPLTTHFIAVSRANLRQGTELGIVPPERGSIIRSGIPIGAFTRTRDDGCRSDGAGLRSELGIPPRAPLVGMVACLKPQKAPLDFVEVAARVAAVIPEAQFMIAGDGELRDAVRQRVETLGLGSRLRLLGWRRDVPRLMAALDVFVLTSLWEGLPRVLPEAIASGVPIVATRVDGTADVIDQGENGFLCDPHDVADLAEKVECVLRDPPLARRLAGRARAVLPEFDIDLMVRRQEALYMDLLRAVRLVAPGSAGAAAA